MKTILYLIVIVLMYPKLSIYCQQNENFPSSVPANIAIGKPVHADSEYNESYIAENAVDGDNSTDPSRWMSGNSSYPHWIEINLEQMCSVTGVNFWTGYQYYRFPLIDYQIQYWDGSSWVDIIDVTGNNNPEITHTFSVVYTNKVRLYCTAGEDNILRLYEIEIIGVESVPVNGVSIDQTGPISIAPGETINLTASVAPESATNKSVQWSSGNNSIAVVNSNGLVTAGVTVSPVTITVITDDGGYTDNIVINVDCDVPVPELNVQKGDKEATLSWNSINDVDGYNISYGTIEGGPYDSKVFIDGSSSNSTIVRDLTNGIPYYFIISSQKGLCESNPSFEVSATPSIIFEYTGPNIYISTIASNKSLGTGMNAVRIDGQPVNKVGFGNFVPLGFVVEISAPNAEESLGACLTFSYSVDDIPEGMNIASIKLFRYNESKETWEYMGGQSDTNNLNVKLCGIDKFSQWTLAGSIPESVPLNNWSVLIVILFLVALIIIKTKK